MWEGIVLGFSFALGFWIFVKLLNGVQRVGLRTIFQWAFLAMLFVAAGLYLLDRYDEAEAHASIQRAQEQDHELQLQKAYDDFGVKVSCKEHPDCATSSTCMVVNLSTDECRQRGY